MSKTYKHVNCSACEGREGSLFHWFCDNQLSGLNAIKKCAYYKKNQALFVEGSMPRGIFCINSGKVKIYTQGEEGKEQIIQIASGGDLLGFRALFSGDSYKVSATALEECNICFIGRSDFLELVNQNPRLRDDLMKELSAELTDKALFITNMAQKSVRQRLASSLVSLAEIYKGDMINLTREDLANYVGTATETTIRLLKDFKDENLIKTHTRKIEVIDIDRLADIASGY